LASQGGICEASDLRDSRALRSFRVLASPFFSFAEPVALALNGDDVGVVDDAIDESGGAGGVGEHRGPVLERQVGREDEALSFVPAADNLKEQVGVARVE
jgi:hypothetical protein